MFMHMKPLYTVKKNQKFFRAPLKNHYLHLFLLLNTITIVCWTTSTSTFNMFRTNKFERILDEDS